MHKHAASLCCFTKLLPSSRQTLWHLYRSACTAQLKRQGSCQQLRLAMFAVEQ